MNQQSGNAFIDFVGNHVDAIIVGILIGVTVSAINLAVKWISRSLAAAEQRKFIASTLKEFRAAMSKAKDLDLVDGDSGEKLGPLSADQQRVVIYKSYIEHLGTAITKRTHHLPYKQAYQLWQAYDQRLVLDKLLEGHVLHGMQQYEAVLLSKFEDIDWLEF